MKINHLLTAILAYTFMTTVSANDTGSENSYVNKKENYGITVEPCYFDYDDDNFCSDKLMKKYATIMKKRKNNFANDKLLYIFQSPSADKNSKYYRLVIIDKKTKQVSPEWFAFTEAYSSHGKPQAVNEKGDTLEFTFNKNSSKFCFKGNIVAYRDSYGYSPDSYPEFCFDYDQKSNSLRRDF